MTPMNNAYEPPKFSNFGSGRSTIIQIPDDRKILRKGKKIVFL